jgi:SapC
MSDQANQDGQLSGAVLLYTRPEPLNPEQHGKLGIRTSTTPYKFALNAHAVPLMVTEFTPAAMNYPIIFAGEQLQPMAIMSIRQNENLFVSPEGAFEADAYVPAYLRRFPFVFADDPENQRMIVCIDVAAEAVTEGGELALFDGEVPTEFTRNAIEFCTNFESERRRTEAFVNTLKELDLFELKEAYFTPQNADGTAGEPVRLADYFAVSETKLQALPLEKLGELRDNGALMQIYAQLVSLHGWDKLVARTIMRDSAATA